MMKGFPASTSAADELVFNYRLSRARRIVECAFGIMANRFRLLRKSMHNSPDNAIKITRCIIALHNFLLENGDDELLDDHEENEHELDGLCGVGRHSAILDARYIREILKDYFFLEGEVDFQWDRT